MASGFDDDPHSERGFECPKNCFGLTDYTDLQALERSFTFKRIRELESRGMKGSFNAAHLAGIHKYIFQDVFPWAGEFRVVNISKGNSMFGPAVHIEAALGDVLSKLARAEFLQGSTAAHFAAQAAFYLGEINAIHPFREGNGRTQREFIRQLAVNAGHPLSWAGFTQEEMVAASILSHTRGDNSQLATIIERALDTERNP